MANELDKRYQNYTQRFSQMPEDQLIGAFNREVGNPGWVGARGAYLSAIHQEFIDRGFDYSAIGDESQMSLANRIKISEGKVSVVETPKK